MRFLNWSGPDRGVQVNVRIQRTPVQWYFHWQVCGRRRYSKRELFDIEMHVRKFVSRRPSKGPGTETHSLWL
jgi:hypothetical protein